jgi:hypothetical protein
MDIIAYTYEADYHCTYCTIARFGQEPGRSWATESATDNEGNAVHPVFGTDEWCGMNTEESGTFVLACGTCGVTIESHEHSL